MWVAIVVLAAIASGSFFLFTVAAKQWNEMNDQLLRVTSRNYKEDVSACQRALDGAQVLSESAKSGR